MSWGWLPVASSPSLAAAHTVHGNWLCALDDVHFNVTTLKPYWLCADRVEKGVELADFCDASHFYDRGFLLPLGKASGLLMIRVNATKSLAVLVKQSHLPMMMFSASIFSI
jgi:hypothetical protein